MKHLVQKIYKFYRNAHYRNRCYDDAKMQI